MFDFSQLAASAVANNNSKGAGRVPSYLLPIEEARAVVKISDGNKKPAEDGSQAITLTIGRVTIALDAVAPKATRINATAEQVEAFTATLQAAVDAGAFDEAIVAAQTKANPANRKVAAPTTSGELVEGAPDGVDLEALDAEEATDDLVI
jgi:hypothetical protein